MTEDDSFDLGARLRAAEAEFIRAVRAAPCGDPNRLCVSDKT